MLVLSRKINETIIIGENIRITLTSIRGQQVRIAIDAPPDVSIAREELLPFGGVDHREVASPQRLLRSHTAGITNFIERNPPRKP